MESLQYPIGRFAWDGDDSPAGREARVAVIEKLPADLRNALGDLCDAQLDTPYRPGGWTLRQVVHHLGDSHINSFCRFRFALTEEAPTVKVYDEARWSALPDAQGPVEPTLMLLDGLHQRWTAMLRAMTEADFARVFIHPENGETSLSKALALYAWHGAHHLRHITMTRESLGW